MAEHRALGEGLRPLKMLLVRGVTAVIDDQNLLETGLQKAVQDAVKLLVRIQRRQDNHTAFCAVIH